MLELTLIRHAKAVSPQTGVADFDRPLTTHGQQDAVRLGHRLAALRVGFDQLLSSPAQRALQTARLIAGEVGYPANAIRTIDDFYNASADTLLAEVQRTDAACKRLAVVGHNPGISWLRQMLTGESLDMSTCAVTVIHFDVDDWQAVHTDAGWVAHHEYPAGLADSGA